MLTGTRGNLGLIGPFLEKEDLVVTKRSGCGEAEESGAATANAHLPLVKKWQFSRDAAVSSKLIKLLSVQMVLNKFCSLGLA